jgi:hypothetical protein
MKTRQSMDCMRSLVQLFSSLYEHRRLKSSVSEGTFSTILQLEAAALGLTTLSSASASSVSIQTYTVSTIYVTGAYYACHL